LGKSKADCAVLPGDKMYKCATQVKPDSSNAAGLIKVFQLQWLQNIFSEKASVFKNDKLNP